jgi:carbon storage regulator
MLTVATDGTDRRTLHTTRYTDIRALGIAVGRRPDRTTPRHSKEEPSMLVLSRQRDETIMIGDDVEITVVDIRGDKVRLGISAPRNIQVHRKEVYDAIRRENQQAAGLKPSDMSDVVKSEPPRKRPDESGPRDDASKNDPENEPPPPPA